MKKSIIIFLFAVMPGALFAASKIADMLLNGIDPIQFVVYIIIAYAGMILNMISDVTRRKPDSITSPTALSFSYWFNDNKARLMRSFITIPIGIIFFNDVAGIEISNLGALMIGLSSDHIWEILKRKNIINNAG